MEKAVLEWIKISEYDLETAKAMHEKGRYLYVAFMCQQSIEKILKAIYACKRKEVPPKTHNLLYLTDIINLDLQKAHKLLLSQLNQFYLESRYPGEQNKLSKEVNKRRSKNYLTKTAEVWQCLKKMIHS